jgi:hypothetical protein
VGEAHQKEVQGACPARSGARPKNPGPG